MFATLLSLSSPICAHFGAIQADGGPNYVHVLRNVASEISRSQIENLNLRPEKQHSLEEYERMRDTIQKCLGESVDSPRHFEKVQWFARYWNKCSPYMLVTGPGMDVNPCAARN